VFDVTGAGDTVIGVLAAALAAGAGLARSTELANVAAGIVVTKLGAACTNPVELANAIGGGREVARGIVPEGELPGLLEAVRARGERLVLTNGCFDILHAGHVSYLQEAARLGDRLIVAVNDDASVARLKGRGRPVNPLAHRMAVLAALAAVDWVVAFPEDTPERLVREIRPDVLVKGGDYRTDEIAGADFVRAQGGEVRVIAIEEECSTSAILRSLSMANGDAGLDP
jgi:D-beta-D-heptose 7-phosphate kinase/D-beta-D-heptose 1-phosphate adenosyltransferase